LIDDGRKGRKAGKGFYRYDSDSGARGKDKKEPDASVYDVIGWTPRPIPAGDIAERCWLQMLNEVARTIEERIVTDPDVVDIGAIFGLGFPPFRGGILREADRVGLDEVVRRLDGYAARHGKRLAPAPLLREMAARGERFHPE
jgi:3-hydroxyacyl-CoA dehydrogenase/enoyl-CoA hydratase/3-hydroxybutyryl-CoA epimerase